MLGLPTAVAADTSCTALQGVLSAHVAGDDGALLAQAMALDFPADRLACQITPVLNAGPQSLCHWTYPYRAAESERGFDALDQAVRACLNPRAKPEEPGVNHPDTYRQAQYGVLPPVSAEAMTLSLSLKDKAAAGTSHVFLRLGQAKD